LRRVAAAERHCPLVHDDLTERQLPFETATQQCARLIRQFDAVGVRSEQSSRFRFVVHDRS
jgi:hypothetical protein